MPTFRPDDVVDPDRAGFHAHVVELGELTGSDTSTWPGYLDALRSRRACLRRGGGDRLGPRAPVTVPRRICLLARRRTCSRRIIAGTGPAGRRRAVPRPDAGRDGGHEPGRRPRAADPCRRVAGPQSDGGRPLRPGPGGRHPPCGGLRARPQAAARPVRQRARPHGRRVHARRDHLQPRARPSGRALPGAAARTALVVLRQPRGDPALLPIRHRDGRVRQHGRLQRRCPLPADHPCPPRRGPAAECRLPGRAGGRAPPARRGRGRDRRGPRAATSPAGRSGSTSEAGRAGGPDGFREVDRRCAGRARAPAGVRRRRRRHRHRDGQDRPRTVGGGWRGRLPAARVGRGAAGSPQLRRRRCWPRRAASCSIPSCAPPSPTASSSGCGPSPATLAGRVRPGDHRPLLGDRPAETLAAMADARSELYRQVATATIDTDDRRARRHRRRRRRPAGGRPGGRRANGIRERRCFDRRTPPRARPSASTASGASPPTRPGRAGSKAGGAAPCPSARRMPVPSSFNDVLVDPQIHDHVGDVWYQRQVFIPRGLGGPACRAAVRRRDPPGRGVDRGHQGARARGRLHAVRGRRDRLRPAGRGAPAHRRRQQRAHVAVHPTRRRRGAAERNPATAPVPRLLQLRRPAPQRLAVHDTRRPH